MPQRELGFQGVPYKASSWLLELIETPFLVRVGFGQKNFDMTIVFMDFKRDSEAILYPLLPWKASKNG